MQSSTKLSRRATTRRSRAQRGVTLIEALVALVVMAFGMVALVGLMTNLRYSSDLAKQRSEAMRLAQADLELLRSFTVLDKTPIANPPAGTTDYDNDLKSKTFPAIVGQNTNATFSLVRTVQPLVADAQEPQAKMVTVRVSWQDRSNTQQTLTLEGIISRSDPAYTMALGVTPPTEGVRTPDDRHPAIPRGAKNLGDGSSAFRPSRDSATVWVFNNLSGVITGKCSIDIDTPITTLTAESVESCKNNTVGYLVSGVIRFSTADSPNPAAPDGAALPVSVYVALRGSEFKDNIGQLLPGGEYPITPSSECFSDAPSSRASDQRLVDYNCIVYPNNQSPRNWWGQVLLSGIDLGDTGKTFKVCRYSADYNGNGYTYLAGSPPKVPFRIDNEEHPEVYRGVSVSLARQNFLVVRGDVRCPTAPAPDASKAIFVDYSTIQLQPSAP
ncbi:type IV pilus modification PilV family protein [Roseateles cellulosilyticus]|uniref:Prepilin-type N-terminal cleavage/methylation domain-containing protein n=1 Tax=Pelomonas cellulosilytica TaxID=2906762 RepID=A0ABS8XVV6_9BURK|nr:prepilin-type N-terminal cleavage/methylation domain-containing protein [Pelomonas sp. P8]MCE4555845.1 prepilin-type N-terminal cleavage/methylation domain-containing protein [Pelomonas sp. P8]